MEKHIVENREYSIAHRDEIREYARSFDWVNVIDKHYVPVIEQLVAARNL